MLTHGGHICISKLSIIRSDDVLLPGRRQTIIWTNAAILLINLRNNFQCNLKRNPCICLQENAFENVRKWLIMYTLVAVWLLLWTNRALWNFDSWAKFHIEGQGQSTLRLMGILIKVFRMFLSEFDGSSLSRWGVFARTSLGVTHGKSQGHTHKQTQATTILTDQNWPRMKPKKLLRKPFNID